MSIDPGIFDPDDPGFKAMSKSGGGRGIATSGPGPGGGFQSFAGGFPGLSSGGLDFGDTSHGNPRAALLKRIMAAIMAAQRPPVDDVNASLQSGETVMNSPASALFGPELEKMNATGNDMRQHFFLGGTASLLDAVSAPTSAGAGAGGGGALASLAGPVGIAMAALSAVKFAADMFGKKPAGPNGLERARGMGYGPEGYAYGGFVRNPYGRYGAGRAGGMTPGGAATAYGGSGYGARQPAQPGINDNPTPSSPGSAPSSTNAPGTTLPTTAYDELLKKYSAQGAFDPGYGMSELEAALNRQNQGAQRADVTDLMASGLDDPSLYASQLLASRGQRSRDASAALASARSSQTQAMQDWIRQLFGARHQDQISELLARIK